MAMRGLISPPVNAWWTRARVHDSYAYELSLGHRRTLGNCEIRSQSSTRSIISSPVMHYLVASQERFPVTVLSVSRYDNCLIIVFHVPYRVTFIGFHRSLYRAAAAETLR